VIITIVDTVFDADFSMIKRLKGFESGIIWVKEVEDYKRFGVCALEGPYLKRIVEKPSEPISRLANIGLYYVKHYKGLFKSIHYLFGSKKMIDGEYYLTDALMHMVDNGARFLCPQVKAWLDFGKKETALESNRLLLKRFNTPASEVACKNSAIIQPVHVANGVVIENSVIGPFVLS
jgi:glucose-1-phosphate thymidylyltransferase